MVNVAVAWWPVAGAKRTAAPPPPLVPSQLFGPRKNSPAAGRSGCPEPVGAQPTMVTWTTPPTGAASGQTVIDPLACRPSTAPTREEAHPAATDAGVGVAATEAVGEDAAMGAAGEDAAEVGATAGVLDGAGADWVDAAGLDAAGLDVVGLDVAGPDVVGALGALGAFEEHAATMAVRAQAAPKVAINPGAGGDLKTGMLRSPFSGKSELAY